MTYKYVDLHEIGLYAKYSYMVQLLKVTILPFFHKKHILGHLDASTLACDAVGAYG